MAERRGKIIGLTGNIGCGKSTAARILSSLGVPVIDADQVAREVVRRGSPALQAIEKDFGQGVFLADGNLDRAALRQMAFKDEKLRKKLESIMHPAIVERSKLLFEEQFDLGNEVVVYEATLLFETGRHKDFDGVLVIVAEQPVQRARLLARDPSIDRLLADQIIGSQMPQSDKVKLATWVIENNGTLEELEEKVRHWYQTVSVK